MVCTMRLTSCALKSHRQTRSARTGALPKDTLSHKHTIPSYAMIAAWVNNQKQRLVSQNPSGIMQAAAQFRSWLDRFIRTATTSHQITGTKGRGFWHFHLLSGVFDWPWAWKGMS